MLSYHGKIMTMIKRIRRFTFVVSKSNLITKRMLTTNEVAQVFDTILSIPGMNEAVRIDVRISRKNVLLLTHVIEQGLSEKGEGKGGIFASAPEEARAELRDLSSDFLQKAGLVELSEKLKALNPGK
jgi:hypothetical protein